LAIVIHEYLDGNGGINASFTEQVNNGNVSGINMTEAVAENNIDPDSIMVGMLAVFCTYGLGLIPQAVQRKAMVMSIWM
jgi:hypothetical protein